MKTYLCSPEAWHCAAQLAGPASWPYQSSSPPRQEDAERVADACRRRPGHLLLAASLCTSLETPHSLPDPLSLSLVPVSYFVSLSRDGRSAVIVADKHHRSHCLPLAPWTCPLAPCCRPQPPRRARLRRRPCNTVPNVFFNFGARRPSRVDLLPTGHLRACRALR